MPFKEGKPKKVRRLAECYNPLMPIGNDGIVERKAGCFVVLAIGDVLTGFSLIGPFMDRHAARKWAQDNYFHRYDIMPVNVPAEVLKKRAEQAEEDRAAGY